MTKRRLRRASIVVLVIALLAVGFFMFSPQHPQVRLVSFPFSLNPLLKLISPQAGIAYETSKQTTYLFLSDLPDEECSGENPGNYSFENFPIKIGDFLALMQGRSCKGSDVSFIPVGLANGAMIYQDHCELCHGTLADPYSVKIGPWLGNILAEGTERIPGTSTAQYVYESIVAPNNFIATGCVNERFCQYPSRMPQDFMIRFSSNYQDLVDLLGYLLARQ